jgi:hypothetical protein
LLLNTSGTGSNNNSAYNTFDHLRIQCNQSAYATGIELDGSGTITAGSAVTQNRFSDVIITGGVHYGIQQELNTDTNYFTSVSVNEDLTTPPTGASMLAINTLNPTVDQDADGAVYDGLNRTGNMADITAGFTSGSSIKMTFGAAPIVVSLGGTQSWILQGVGLPNIAASISVPTLTVTKGITPSGPGFQHQRVAGCTTNNGVGWSCGVSITWAKSFPDTNYSLVCSIDGSSSFFGYAMPVGKSATGVTVDVVNGTPSQVFTATAVDCIAVHD